MNLYFSGVFKRDVFGLAGGLFHHLDADEFADAVGNVYNVIALLQIEHAVHGRNALNPADTTANETCPNTS